MKLRTHTRRLLVFCACLLALTAHAAPTRQAPPLAAPKTQCVSLTGIQVPPYQLPGHALPTTRGAQSPEQLLQHKRRLITDLADLDLIASMVAHASGHRLRGQLTVSEGPLRGLAQVTGPPLNGQVVILKAVLQQKSANSIAFIIGHEFAHQTDPRAMVGPGITRDQRENAADIRGAEFAMCAGFDLDDYLVDMFQRTDRKGRPLGVGMRRAQLLQAHFGRTPTTTADVATGGLRAGARPRAGAAANGRESAGEPQAAGGVAGEPTGIRPRRSEDSRVTACDAEFARELSRWATELGQGRTTVRQRTARQWTDDAGRARCTFAEVQKSGPAGG